MRYAVSNTGNKQDFEKDWYIASGFGEPRKNSAGVVTYYHEGVDINLRTGGDTDLNQELKAIANGKIVYYHQDHANISNTFGRHLVYKIDGAWGTRWIHYAHCSELNFLGSEQEVMEGQVIARIGKSGTSSAHLHMSIFKIDPVTLGIDNIANNQTELNQHWEDPIAFIDKWIVAPATKPVITDQTKINLGAFLGEMEVQAIRSTIIDTGNKVVNLTVENNNLRLSIESLNKKLTEFEDQSEHVALLENQVTSLITREYLIKQVVFGKGWTWIKISALKKLLA